MKMYRTILSLILIGTMLFGQSFCCCTLRALGSTNIEASDSCCCNGSSEPSEGCPLTPGDDRHQCPCKKDKLVNGEPLKQVLLPQGYSENWHFLVENVAHSVELAVVFREIEQSIYSRSTSFPNLDGVGILRAVCSLRC